MLQKESKRAAARSMIALALSACSVGCAASSLRVHSATEPKGPISLTSTVYDATGKPLRVGEGLEVVGHFDYSKRIWSLLFGVIPLSGDIDIAAVANEEMDKAGGVGVVNLAVETSSNGALKYIGTLVPILPMYVAAKLEGDVVRVSTQK